MRRLLLITSFFFCFTVNGVAQVFHASFDADTIIGVMGNAKLFDGYFTNYTVASSTLVQSQNFTVEAWIAPQEYAVNIAAIADKEKDFTQGYLFGINQKGQLVGSLAVDTGWISCTTVEAVPLLKWAHVAMVVSEGKELSLYLNGRKVGSKVFNSQILFCVSCALSIGKTQTASPATNTERATSMNIKTVNRFDGLMDEFYIHPFASSDEAIAKKFSSATIANPQPLRYRQMPSGPVGPSTFGAFYTKLHYSKAWDSLWRGSEYPDIVVRFENTPVRYVFWRGTGYIPAIVNEKNMWMTDQSLEHYGTGECYEAMGDKQTRYSHVRIIENTPARVVIHWRYALAGISHQLLHIDENGWSDWADEYWTIYPDGIAARKQVLWSTAYEKDKGVMQWQETIFFSQPGTRPQDNVDLNAITFMDMKGEKAAYSWQDGPPKTFATPRYKPIELVNFKAAYKPFSIFDEKRICNPFSFGLNKEYTTIPNWNHWPVQQVPSDGRTVVAPDKPSHSSLTGSNGKMQIVEKKSDGEYWACSLRGMTDKPIDSLMPLAKSWNNAPPIINAFGGSATFDKYERAYIFKTVDPLLKQLSFTVNATPSLPLYNLPVVIDSWNAASVSVRINNQLLKQGKDYRVGFVPELEENKILLFINTRSTAKLNVVINKR